VSTPCPEYREIRNWRLRGVEKAVNYLINKVHSESGVSFDKAEILNTISTVKNSY
jgi:hypothetical protein